MKRIKAFACAVLRVVDDIAIALRTPLKAAAALGVMFQGAIASGNLKFAEGSRWPNAIAVANILLAYVTIRGVEGNAIARADAKASEQP